MPLCGGYSDIKTADADIQSLFSSPEALSGVSAALGRSVASLTVEAFRTQVVAGLNYKVKAAVDGASVIITAFKPLPHTGQSLSITAVVEGEEL